MIDLWRKEAYSSFIKPEKSPGGNFLSSFGIIWAQREMTLTKKSQKKNLWLSTITSLGRQIFFSKTLFEKFGTI